MGWTLGAPRNRVTHPIGVVLAVCCLLCVQPSAASAQGVFRGNHDPDVGHALGDPGAPVTVIEYADFACSACAEFARDSWPQLRRELVETGRVYWRIVPFSIGFRHGQRAVRAGECAALQGGFWPMHDELFAQQDRWMEPRRPEDTFQSIAESVGLDPTALRECMDDNVPEARMDRAQDEAQDAGVRATPTFLVNGRPVLGALPFEMFVRAVEAAEARGSHP